MEESRTYVVSLTRVSVSTIKTLIQIVAGANPLKLVRARLGQTTGTSITMLPIQINRKTAVGTVTSFTPLKLGPSSDPASLAVGGAALTGTNATVEGTDGDILAQGVFNYVNEWIWTPNKDERIWVPPSGIICLKLPVAPSATIFTADLVFKELG